MVIGKINRLKMIRKSDLGFNLSDGKDTVLLHYKEATRELKEQEEVHVFVYLDKLGRPCATMQEPKITCEQGGFVEVVGVTENGVYIDNSCAKDVLVSKDHLPYDRRNWPIVGDTLYCILKVKNNKMLAKPLNKDEILYSNEQIKYALKEKVEGFVCRIGENGIGVITKDKTYVFIPTKQLRGTYRLGQEVQPHITSELKDGYFGSLLAQKELLLDDDSLIILAYLKKKNGIMNLTAKSSAEDVFKELKMSRKAFKRALGNLYKERKVECKENETILLKEKE